MKRCYYVISKADSKQTRLAKKRFRKRLKRKLKEYQPDNKARSTIKFSEAIELFCNKNHHLSNRRTAKLRIHLNENFSLFNNPDLVTLKLLHILMHGKDSARRPTLKYDGSISFGAIFLIDNLCHEVAKKRSWVVNLQEFPLNQSMMLRNLRSIVSSKHENNENCMINEIVYINRRETVIEKQEYQNKATEITNMIEKAIRQSSGNLEFTLPLAVHGPIKSAIGEQFDNILMHAKGTEYGTLCCFYDKTAHIVTILIYNFGKSIADTLTFESLPEQIADAVALIIKHHVRKKFLNLHGLEGFTVENLLTLLAIQEGVSTNLKDDLSRGHGIIDFIDQCFNLSEDTKVAIISGQTAIKIDKKYRIASKNVFGRERKILALNSDNDIFKKPDERYIRSIKANFNGVIIETTIPLNIN